MFLSLADPMGILYSWLPNDLLFAKEYKLNSHDWCLCGEIKTCKMPILIAKLHKHDISYEIRVESSFTIVDSATPDSIEHKTA